MITPSLNQATFIERTIQSVISQQGDFDLEYLVFDGASTDGTLEILSRYEDRLMLRTGKDDGQADAVNKGLATASGDILAWVNSDDVLLPGAIAEVVAAFRDRPDIQWVHGRCLIVDEFDRPIRRALSAYKDFRCRRHRLSALLIENYVSQMTVFWKRELLATAGGLDIGLKYAFDYELWLRFAKLSAPHFIDRQLAAFRWYTGSKSGSSFVRQFEEDYAVFLRHAPRSRFLRLRKRLRTSMIVSAYRLFATFARRGSQ